MYNYLACCRAVSHTDNLVMTSPGGLHPVYGPWDGGEDQNGRAYGGDCKRHTTVSHFQGMRSVTFRYLHHCRPTSSCRSRSGQVQVCTASTRRKWDVASVIEGKIMYIKFILSTTPLNRGLRTATSKWWKGELRRVSQPALTPPTLPQIVGVGDRSSPMKFQKLKMNHHPPSLPPHSYAAQANAEDVPGLPLPCSTLLHRYTPERGGCTSKALTHAHTHTHTYHHQPVSWLQLSKKSCLTSPICICQKAQQAKTKGGTRKRGEVRSTKKDRPIISQFKSPLHPRLHHQL
ncbi:hypothetical protein N657DRAFT_199395 [Parathielavia appendiculata]|uniref:Uncharacterized protein n=1 Tax=Parathielavia appendiculata TaxID=2587402 RepID=A0AAN6U727_9PEZI|nr:hypothetical protein N657DRAFT_199395 [Parathielavia appendiculata]